MNKVSFIITDTGIQGVLNGSVFQILRNDFSGNRFSDIVNYLASNANTNEFDSDEFAKLLVPFVEKQKKMMSSIPPHLANKFSFTENGVLTYHYHNSKEGKHFDVTLSNKLSDRIQKSIELNGYEALIPLMNFLDKTLENPKAEIMNELFDFLEANDLPLTPDGCFLAYKAVSKDYLDLYTHSISNKIGVSVSMERSEVDADRTVTCSKGLHIASFDYVRNMSKDRVVIVKVNPKDVVAIPTDYDNQKARCCYYKVVGEVQDMDKYKIRPYVVFNEDENFTITQSEYENIISVRYWDVETDENSEGPSTYADPFISNNDLFEEDEENDDDDYNDEFDDLIDHKDIEEDFTLSDFPTVEWRGKKGIVVGFIQSKRSMKSVISNIIGVKDTVNRSALLDSVIFFNNNRGALYEHTGREYSDLNRVVVMVFEFEDGHKINTKFPLYTPPAYFFLTDTVRNAQDKQDKVDSYVSYT